ncbi:uncharacterized protein LACBIDRAFT_325771 [Laccaria bicolor S238N-H82]|uniref:Predicted protein n=1 Tax=Laccaria bicolor (strain S238N-H82 / ATCC MYA-4686) TaxID=486041 RepID=B0D660_LACBS|nr:uncharacterized protein LACBIDRAFT_325771 [Laccaria bicolor S238N-H82]EDR10142.1 predicted protein [Laccaria bicolor S238N-H82]|eukprot:XP_001879527.1 predicted protein [Laccaria bicolor S238N-H82]
MPHITQDPNLEVSPKVTSAALDAVCTALTTAEGIDKVVVAARLADAWVADNTPGKRLGQHRLAHEAGGLRELRKEEEAEEKEKKRPKLKGFIANKPVRDNMQLPFVLHDTHKRNYMELYSFMMEGCLEAVRLNRTIAQDAFTFAKANDTLLLKPLASHKPSNKVILDEDLTWHQMSITKSCLLHHMSQKWLAPATCRRPHRIYLNLESHPMWLQVDGDTVLLHYEAQVQHEWHKSLCGANDKPAVDISVINVKHVEAIRLISGT